MGWEILLLWFVPALVFALVLRLPAAFDLLHDAWLRRRARRLANGPTIERLAEDLRRISAEIERVQLVDPPYKMTRLRAAVAAYDDTLLTCCRTLGVRPPRDRGPLDARERLDAEVALLQEGLTW
jgi:hypothetical protein